MVVGQCPLTSVIYKGTPVTDDDTALQAPTGNQPEAILLITHQSVIRCKATLLKSRYSLP